MAQHFNHGSAWPVKEKKSEKHPGYSGEANIDGVLYFMDVWVKEHEGRKWLSFSFKKKDKQEGAAQAMRAEDDIPQ